MKPAIKKALEEGKLLIRRIFPNTNSAKNQVTVQFYKRITVPSDGNVNVLVAIAQGIEGAGHNNVTANFSFNADTVKARMPEVDVEQDNNFFESDTVVEASVLFGEATVDIEVEENFDSNEYDTNGEVVRTLDAKVNPTTGEVLEKGGQPIYRHTRLVAGTANHTFVQHDRVSATQPVVKTENKIDAGAVS